MGNGWSVEGDQPTAPLQLSHRPSKWSIILYYYACGKIN